jgi:thiamine biosynthesis lipoprotein
LNLIVDGSGVLEGSISALGSEMQLQLVGASDLDVEFCAKFLKNLDFLWDRMVPTSEISRLNATAGVSVSVSPETYELVARSVFAWHATKGLFDPTVFPSAMYSPVVSEMLETTMSAGPGFIELSSVDSTVLLPVGCAFDPTGIGKGLALDLLIEALLDERRIKGACLSIDGITRMRGEAPTKLGWRQSIADPFRRDALAVVALEDGAVVTNSRLQRTELGDGEVLHHVLNPRTGTMVKTDWVSVTTVSGDGWWAEAWAKAAFVMGDDTAWSALERANATGMSVDQDGFTHAAPSFANVATWIRVN